ncbi:unnamed protein product [Paramecium pentaurelia]|uniref:Ubiquitin-like protease family profile domain-containing protein n=1 Tax=Paramecium pentaurelia TaxID=43138 RepID=A0A8S1SDL7_9CILI|nr:unnamed protein product [Paramecium pentaurelia]
MKTESNQRPQIKVEDMLKQFKNINVRKNGVTIDYQFLLQLANQERQLTSQHMLFFISLFQKYFSKERKIFVADHYFFVDYMPLLTKQLTTNVIQSHEKDYLQLIIPDNPYPPTQPINLNEPFYEKKKQVDIVQTNQANKKQQIQQLQETPNGKKYQFVIQNIEVTKAEEGKFRIKTMQNKLDQYLIQNQLNFSINPIYQHEFTFFPINLKNAHWMSINIDLKKQIILYQDSAFIANNDIKEGIQKIIDYKKPSKVQWKLQTKSPQQRSSQDCGVFVLYALFNLFTEGQFVQEKQYDQNYISMVRQNLLQLTIKEAEAELTPELVEKIVKGL